MKRFKKGIVLPSLDDEAIKKAFEYIERAAPHLTCGMIWYKNNANSVRARLKYCHVPSLSWYDDDNFLYWGHEKFTRLNWSNYLGEL